MFLLVHLLNSKKYEKKSLKQFSTISLCHKSKMMDPIAETGSSREAYLGRRGKESKLSFPA